MFSKQQLVIFDADGTIVDAFSAIAKTFAAHNMDIGDLRRFQKRHNLLKYLGGVKEFPSNLRHQLSSTRRRQLVATLTEVYREETRLYAGVSELLKRLSQRSEVRMGVVTRNITNRPEQTLRTLFKREGVDEDAFDFLIHLPLKQAKTAAFERLRDEYRINPARGYACGDEFKDYKAAVKAGLHPLIVSYGFENHARLSQKFEVPSVLISQSPQALGERLCNALGDDAQ